MRAARCARGRPGGKEARDEACTVDSGPMPTIRVTTVPDPALLLERAVEGVTLGSGIGEAAVWPTLSAWIVLRQGGLRDDLHRLLAERGLPGWFGAPVCLFSELPERWGAVVAQGAPLTDPERHALLSALLDDPALALFRRSGADAWVTPVDRLVGELMGEGIAPDDFRRALAGASGRDGRPEADAATGDAFTAERADALARIYAEWHRALERLGRTDGRDGRVRLAREIETDPAGFAARLGGRREVRIVGLADLRGGWRPLLRALQRADALDSIEILTNAGAGLAAELGANHDVATSPPSTAAQTLLEAPDVAREVEHIAVRVRALLDSGAPPHRIAVIARQARPLVDDLAGALTRAGVPVTARRRTRLAHTAPARALRAILALPAESWSRHSVVEFAENPLLKCDVPARIINLVGFERPILSRGEWTSAFETLLAKCEAPDGDTGETRGRSALPPGAEVRAALDAWTFLEARWAPLDVPRPLVEWFRWVRDVLTDGDWGIAAALDESFGDDDAWRTDRRAADAIADAATAWERALRAFGSGTAPMTAERFAERLGVLLDEDLVTLPASDFGVVVAEALATGWRAFDHVFVAGLTAGEFPVRPGRDVLLDTDERKALIANGLPLDAPDAWRARERALFDVLCAAPRSQLTLSWSATDLDGRDVARSAFVDDIVARLAGELGAARAADDDDQALISAGILERVPSHAVITRGFPSVRDAATLTRAEEIGARERQRSRTADAYNGAIEDAELLVWLAEQYGPRYVWSATLLEKAAVCGWQAFAERLLRLAVRAEAEDVMEPTTRGVMLHDALARFFAAARKRTGTSAAVVLRADAAWAEALMDECLTAAWDEAARAGAWLGPQVLHTAARAALLRDLLAYLEFEITWNEDARNPERSRAAPFKTVRTGAHQEEVRFGPIEISGGDVRFRLQGIVDRVDLGVDERIGRAGADDDADARPTEIIAAIDYKTSVYSTPAQGTGAGWADGVVLQLPLYAAALAALRPHSELARIEYRSIRKPKSVHALNFIPMNKRGRAGPDAKSQQRYESALEAAGKVVERVRGGTFAASPAPSCGCPSYCVARDICRIPGGPESSKWP